MKKQNIGKWGGMLSLLLCLFCLFSLVTGAQTPKIASNDKVYVGGTPFGVQYLTDGILVVGHCDVTHKGCAKNPARDAGIAVGDTILAVNGKQITTASELASIVGEHGEKPLTLTVRHEGAEHSITLTPLPCDTDGVFRTGLWVRDSGAGIGTVTFVTDDNRFGGLGHGICDSKCGALIPISRGNVMSVCIGGIKRGAVGAPGELRGQFEGHKTGTLFQNTSCGVFGMLTERPAQLGERVKVGSRHEIHEGEASCRCTLDGGAPREYKIKISDIRRDSTDNKSFTVTVTDKALLEKTGGIVQGMSGSPIIQNGKLVGAVTHVLIGDPTTGYGIFIENMLAQMGDLAG